MKQTAFIYDKYVYKSGNCVLKHIQFISNII